MPGPTKGQEAAKAYLDARAVVAERRRESSLAIARRDAAEDILDKAGKALAEHPGTYVQGTLILRVVRDIAGCTTISDEDAERIP